MASIIITPPGTSGTGDSENPLLIEPKSGGKALPLDVGIFPLSNFVAFPHMILPVMVPPGRLQDALHDSTQKIEHIGFLARKTGKGEDPSPQDLYEVGVVGKILKVLRLPEGSTSMIVQTLKRFHVKNFTHTVPYIKAHVEYLEDVIEDKQRAQALAASAQNLLQEAVQLSPTISDEFSITALNIEGPKKLSDFIASHLKRIELSIRQSLLEITTVEDRLEKCVIHLTQELEILKMGQKIQGEIHDKIHGQQKEFFLREQLKAIRKELGEEKDGPAQDIKKLKERLDTAGLPEEAQKKADEELKRLQLLPTESSEHSLLRNYLDWIASLPWNKTSNDLDDLGAASKILERDHFGLKDIKERILEFLAVKHLKKDLSGSILCFVGPPGVGKTSLGRSIAEALGRKFTRMSLGGMRDEAEIKGHRRTYVGAMPGRLIQSLKKTETKNPVILLDEIDKIGTDWRGDPASALLEVLDPEQNKTFVDHYLDLNFDLSKILFVCTANTTDTIPAALKDRLEIIELSGYIESEKLAIAEQYLFPKQLSENGINKKHLQFSKDALKEVVRSYTRESGVRSLERQIGKVCRKVATAVATKKTSKITVTRKNLSEYLGVQKFTADAMIPRRPGVAMGLAWTNYGGEVLFIEASEMPGSKNLQLTGKLGNVMTESAKIALSYIRTNAKKLNIKLDDFEKSDLHIHFPAGAVPKDGPSAGITIATALASLYTKRPVRRGLAMTGELSLLGQVLAIGGLKQKLIAAHVMGCKEVLIPFDNKKDLAEIPSEVKKGLKIHLVKTFDDVFKAAFKK